MKQGGTFLDNQINTPIEKHRLTCSVVFGIGKGIEGMGSKIGLEPIHVILMKTRISLVFVLV